jgi:hypothetical protein
LLCAAFAGYAQESRATLRGRVLDAQGAVVPGATVVVTSVDTKVKQQTSTNEAGLWVVHFLIPGNYVVTVSMQGFKTVERKGIELQVADDKQLDLTLEVGGVNETISVTAEAPLIDTTAATSGTVITEQQILEMPSMSRVTTLLATLSPGVMAQDQNQNVAHLWSYNAGSQFTANGGRNTEWSNSFELDGMPNTRDGGKVAFIPPPDAVQEFRVQMNAYDSTIGRQAGSTIQMAIKSGTSAYHGSAYWFNQNNILNANLFQTNMAGGSKPAVHFNEYGGTFGGPVWIPRVYNGKDRTFFFLNFDGTRNADPRFSTRSVPADLERKGDFSQSFTTQSVGGQLVPYPIMIYDPLLVDSRGYRQPFPNNVIPTGRLDPIALKILSYVPLPNKRNEPTSNTASNFVPDSSRQNKMALLSMRFDQQWNNAHKSFASLRWYHEDELTGDDFHNAASGAYQTRIPQGLGLDHVWTLGPSKVLDLRWNISRFVDDNRDHGAGFDPTPLGFPKSFISQLERPSFPRITGLAGDFGASSAGNFTATNNYSWIAVMNQTIGKMTLKYGGEFWILQRASKDIGNQGQFDFGGNWTRQQTTVGGGTGNGSTFASFLLGLPQGGNIPRNANAYRSQHFYALYAQDDWRVTPKLTLNAGMRWDYETPVVERFNRSTSRYDFVGLNPINDSATAAYAKMLANNAANANAQALAALLPASAFKVRGNLLFNGVNGVPRGTHSTATDLVQPRIGFAYRLRPHTVIRGGLGKFVMASFDTGGQTGFSRTTNFTATQDNYSTPYDTLSNPFRGGILAPTGSSLGPMTNLGQGPGTLYAENAPRMYSWEYSLHLQQEWKGWLFEAGYTHNKTHGISNTTLNQNLVPFDVWRQTRQPRFDSTGRPLDNLLYNELVPNPFYQLAGVSPTAGAYTGQTLALNQFLRPVTILGGTGLSNAGWGTNQYDAMLVKIQHRFRGGFSVINSFTWSKLFENTSWTGPEEAGALQHVEHKLGGEDRPFHFSVAPIWEVPIGRGKKVWRSMPKALDFLFGGWQLSGQFNIQSGTPVVFSTDSFFDGKNFALPKNKQDLEHWFDTTHFYRFPARNCDQTCLAAYPAWTGIQNLPGYNWKPTSASDATKNGVYQDFGIYQRNYPTRWGFLRNPRVNNVDAGIFKNFKIRERIKVQYRFEAFNGFNHPRHGGVTTDPTSGDVGRVDKNQQNGPRQIQMALKLSF